ncbi:MAG: YiiX/YebB-like N1pC/P60 family cysteine hydrolase [Bacteroidota bacterium]
MISFLFIIVHLFSFTQFTLQEGDLLFQDSDCGPFCDAIEKVTEGYQGANLSHVGMVISVNEELAVIEAITKGVVITPLDTFLNRSFDQNGHSKVLVGRLKDGDKSLVEKAVNYARTLLGKSYDTVFDIQNDQYYCSELVYESFKNANEGVPIFKLYPMTFKDPDTESTFAIWEDYYADIGSKIPEGEPGLNPGGISRSDRITIVHVYGKPSGMQ